MTPDAAALTWGDEPSSRVPGWVYTDATLYQGELERLFCTSRSGGCRGGR